MKTLNVDNTYKINTNPTINELLQENKKIVSFIGASQSGTSFLVNNIARILARRNFDVAILDMTQNKDSYYIYTQNKESIRVSIRNSFKDLSEGKLNGLQIENNLTVYTDVPGKNEYSARVENILETLLKKHQVVIIDTDFSTDADYFAYSEQVYLVQTMDILTIQPLTEFLSNLKSKNAINNEKIRIILNKFMNFDEITVSTLMSCTLSPSTSASMRFPSLFTHRRRPRPTSCRFCVVLSLCFIVQIWNTFGLSQPSRRAEWEKINRVGSSKDSSRSLFFRIRS